MLESPQCLWGRPQGLGACLILLVAVSGVGCVGDFTPPTSRYVGDLVGLQRVKRGPWSEKWVRPGVDLSRYVGVTLAPARLADPFDMHGDRYRARDLAFLQRRFDDALKRAFEATGMVREAPGPGVLLAEPTLQGAQANRPPMDTTDQTILARAVGVGGATMQLALRDVETGELLVAVYARKWGTEFTMNFNRNSTWGDVEDAFRFWARQLRQMLERDGVGGASAAR